MLLLLKALLLLLVPLLLVLLLVPLLLPVQRPLRVLLLPVRQGEALPVVAYDAARGEATVTWQGQEDRIAFAAGQDGRTRFTVRRGGETVAATP